MTQPNSNPFPQFEHVEHARRGGDYAVLGTATLQMEPGRVFSDYDALTIYLSDHGRLCARAPDEMSDGRFRSNGNRHSNAMTEALEELVRTIASGGDVQAQIDALRQLAARSVVLDHRAMVAGEAAFQPAAE